MIRSAYVRVYVPASRVGPLQAFRGSPPSGEPIMQNSRYIWDEPLTDDGFYTEWNGNQYLCPRNVRVRMLESILAFSRTYPMMPGASESKRNEYMLELNRLRRQTPHSKSHILSSAWHVPLRWFTAFRSTERDIYEGTTGPAIRYRATIGDAIDRVRWARNVLDGAGFSEQVVDRVHDLERWLAGFTADSLAELDYGAVSASFPDGDLVFDESASDIRTSLLALESGDFDVSREAYERVARRWAAPQAYTYNN
jgi:hypothetical protein